MGAEPLRPELPEETKRIEAAGGFVQEGATAMGSGKEYRVNGRLAGRRGSRFRFGIRRACETEGVELIAGPGRLGKGEGQVGKWLVEPRLHDVPCQGDLYYKSNLKLKASQQRLGS